MTRSPILHLRAKGLAQPAPIESKAEAGTTVGADYVAKSSNDGSTLLVGAVHPTIAPSAYNKLPAS